MTEEQINHKPGCDALGGYGHGVGPCTCKGVLGHSRQCAMFDESMMEPKAHAAGASSVADPTDPGYDVETLREHIRHLERRLRQLHAATPSVADTKPCTCHLDDNPPVPCAKQYALSECRSADNKENN